MEVRSSEFKPQLVVLQKEGKDLIHELTRNKN